MYKRYLYFGTTTYVISHILYVHDTPRSRRTRKNAGGWETHVQGATTLLLLLPRCTERGQLDLIGKSWQSQQSRAPKKVRYTILLCYSRGAMLVCLATKLDIKYCKGQQHVSTMVTPASTGYIQEHYEYVLTTIIHTRI